MMGIQIHLIAMLGAVSLAAIMAVAPKAEKAVSNEQHGTILLNSQYAGFFAEKTTSGPIGVESVLETRIVFNRFGSKVEYRVAGIYCPNAAGELRWGHVTALKSGSGRVSALVAIANGSLWAVTFTGDAEDHLVRTLSHFDIRDLRDTGGDAR